MKFPCCSYLLQKVSEKVGGAEGTKLDDDFKEMERVSLCFLALPWHGVVPCKRGLWCCSVPESQNVLSLWNTCSLPFEFWKRNGKHLVFSVSLQRLEPLWRSMEAALFLMGFVITFLKQHGAELRLKWLRFGWGGNERGENGEWCLKSCKRLSLWLQWTFLLGCLLEEAGQTTEERGFWECSWPDLHSVSTIYCKSPVFVEVSIFRRQ